MSTQHVIVIGAGIVGVSTALRARRHGLDVTLIDRLPPGDATSFGNAGVLASLSVIPVTVPCLLGKVPKMLMECITANGQIMAGFVLVAQAEATKLLSNADEHCYPMFRALLEACRTHGDSDGTSRVQAVFGLLSKRCPLKREIRKWA